MNKIYLIPYAGADISCFNSIKEKLQGCTNGSLEVVPVELKGHGKRRKEKLYESMVEAVEDVIREIEFGDDDIYLYGHCIGGIIAYAVYEEVKKRRIGNINRVFLGSSIICKASADGFENYLSSYVEENIRLLFPDLPDSMLKQISDYKQEIVKHEFDIVMDYFNNNPINPDGNQILIFGREDGMAQVDDVYSDYKQLKGLKSFTVEGGHFFLDEAADEVAEIINNIIKQEH